MRVAAALTLTGLAGLLAWAVVPSVETYRRAEQNLADISEYAALLHAANRLSSERGPSNLAMSIEPGADPAVAAKLADYRRATDMALQGVDAVRDPRFQAAAAPLATARRYLAIARATIDRLSAQPSTARRAQDISAAVRAMFAAVDTFQPAIADEARELAEREPTLAGPALVAHAVSDLREFGGRLGSVIVPAVSKRRALTPDEVREYDRIAGRIAEIDRLLAGHGAFVETGPFGKAAVAVRSSFFGEGLGLLGRLVALGRAGGNYGLAPAALSDLYAPTLKPLEDLRDHYIERMVATVSAERTAALARLGAVLTVSLLVIALLVSQIRWVRRTVIGPLFGLRQSILGLAGEGSAPAGGPPSSILEIRSLFDALGVLSARLAERGDLTEELRRRAETDELTGLSNRSHFEAHAAAALAGAATGRFAMLYIDLDDFKTVNDTLGHHVGDKLLVEVARRLRACARGRGFVARLGGDEFACCADLDPSEHETLARDILQAFALPFNLGGRRLAAAASIGLASGGGASVGYAETCRQADIALYRAKAAGRNTWRRFSQDMLADVVERSALKTHLASALALGQFRLAYQPIVDLATGAVVSYEALLRWTHPERGAIGPDVFVPLLEETGRIVEVGRWVVEEATRAASAWPDGIAVAVNVSALQLDRPRFSLDVAQALMRSGLPAARLHMEITESALVGKAADTGAQLEALRKLGVGLAIDDFGTGYSSVGYMRGRRFDALKLDRSFVCEIGSCPDSEAILRCVIELARDLGIRTVGEGIETEAQRDWLRAHGCDEGQGWLFGRPAEAPGFGACGAADGFAAEPRLSVATPAR